MFKPKGAQWLGFVGLIGADGKRLKKISLRNESGERTAAAVEVEEGAVLEADVIEADSGRIGSVVKGKITGDVVNLQGSFINLYIIKHWKQYLIFAFVLL